MRLPEMPEWTKFAVGNSPPELTSVSHIAHVDTAVRIVSDKQLNAGLIYDNSTLNTERILVVWLSPNDWSPLGGFRYGNIGFQYDWSSIPEGKNYYWVGVIYYQVPALRILITQNDYSHLKTIKRYDPSRRDGPWWYDATTNKHYWNGDYCLEILFEGDLPLQKCNQIYFVKHDDYKCSRYPKNCYERGLIGQKGAGLFLAGLASRMSDSNFIVRKKLQRKLFQEMLDGQIVPKWQFQIAWAALQSIIKTREIVYRGRIKAKEPRAKAVARAVLNAISNRAYDEVDFLLRLFNSYRDAMKACRLLVADWLGVDVKSLVIQ